MSPIPTLDIIGGYKIPMVGLGLGGMSTKDGLENAIELAIENGYRHFDTAYVYGTEDRLGNVLQKLIAAGKVKREELFIVTKLPPFGNSADRVEKYLKESLERLKLDYVDLYLIHSPMWSEPKDPNVRFGEQIGHPTDHVALWKKLEEQVDAGRTKSIGLSNFNITQISRILKIARIKPAALQVQIYLYLQSEELVKYCQENGIVVVAYSPLGSPSRSSYTPESGLPASILEDPVITELAVKHKKTPGQILLKYSLQRNIVVIPKSFNPTRLLDNINLFDFTLDESDLAALKAREVGEKARLGPGRSSLINHPEYPHPIEEVSYVKRNPFPPK